MYRPEDLTRTSLPACFLGRLDLLPLLVLVGALLSIFVPSCARAQETDLSRYAFQPINIVAGGGTGGLTPGIPATSGTVSPTSVATTDSSGNFYFTDTAGIGAHVWVFYAGGPVPPLLSWALSAISSVTGIPVVPPTAGTAYTIVNASTNGGDGGSPCTGASSCGDSGPAALANLSSLIYGLAFDSQGNLYIADAGDFCIRKVSVSDGTISTFAGDPNHSNSTYNGDGIAANTAYLNTPTYMSFDGNNNLFFADSGSNLVRRIAASTNIITTVAGDNTQPGMYCMDSICGEGGPATSALLGDAAGVAVDQQGDIFVSEVGTSVVRVVNHSSHKINTVAGQINVFCSATASSSTPQVCGDGAAATQASLNLPYQIALNTNGNLIIADNGDDAVRAVLADGTITTIAGSITQPPSPPLIPDGTGNGGQAAAATLINPEDAVLDSAGNLYIADQNLIWKVNVPANLVAQTITFNSIPSTTYGATTTIDLTQYASSTSGLPLAFTCKGPATCSGTTLTIRGSTVRRGPITVTANQFGDDVYLPALPQTVTFTVAQAPLTVQANDLSFPHGATQLPTLTYTFTGRFFNGDTPSVITGSPVLTTTATLSSPIGNDYTITLALGTLSALNYTLTPANGTLTVTGTTPQTITFSQPAVSYGTPTFSLKATSSSGLPITYTYPPPIGPVTPSGTGMSNLTVTGVGTVTVTATQLGNDTYRAATSVTQTFQVNPAVLTITAQPASVPYGQEGSTYNYTASGFVNGDTSTSVFSQGEVPAFSSTATTTSVPGVYPLTISQGTLTANNYTFNFVPSTLTVTQAPQTITFPPPALASPAVSATLSATASSNLPVQFTVTGDAAISGNQVIPSGPPGPVTITATQPGNNLYLPATPVSQSFTFVKSPVSVVANNFTRSFGYSNPTFTYAIAPGGFVYSYQYAGQPTLTTAADENSPPGQYPIVINPGTLTSSYFDFQLVNGTLTILPAASFTLSAQPAAVTVPVGQARQVTLILTPVNNFVGAVTVGCSGLPAGVTCVSSPATLTTTQGVSGVAAVMGTLTISAGAQVASAQNHAPEIKIRAASGFWLASLLFGAMSFWQRRRLFQAGVARRMLLFTMLFLGASSLISCSSPSGSSSSQAAQPGTTTVQVTGSATIPSGPVSGGFALSVTIQ